MGWQDAPEVKAVPAWASAPEVEPQGIGGQVVQQLGNAVAGLARGAGSIGATLLRPVNRYNADGSKVDASSADKARRASMDEALQSLGAQPDSLAYRGGKLISEIAGTLGAGGVAARGLGAIGASPAIVEAVRTAGMTGGSMPIRMAGGAISGAASAGLVNPEDATTGAAIGAALPPVAKAAGVVGSKIGGVLRGPAQPDDLANAVQQARSVGYVIPPTQARPTLANRMLEGMSGKITTAQNASARNQEVTGRLAAEAIGLPPGSKITTEVLDEVRKKAGAAYADVASLPKRPAINPDMLTNTPGSQAIDPAKMVFDLRKARNDATAWFRSYGRTADPDALVKAKSAADLAKKLESTLEEYAASIGRDDLVPAMREARQQIAKTYSIEAALNPATGSVDARKLAQQLAKNKPLSGELKQAAEFASRFPKAAQTIEGMGSLPQTSPLDWVPASALSMATANPLMLLGVGARPAARALTLSPAVQNSLVQPQGANALQRLLENSEIAQLGYRAAPVLAGGR